jgi:hypothetical protein
MFNMDGFLGILLSIRLDLLCGQKHKPDMPLILLPDVLVDEEAAVAPPKPALLHRHDELPREAWTGRAGHASIPGKDSTCFGRAVLITIEVATGSYYSCAGHLSSEASGEKCLAWRESSEALGECSEA